MSIATLTAAALESEPDGVSSDGAGSPEVPDNLATRTRTGMVYSTASRVASQILQLGVSIVLARLIAPGQYGLIAIVFTLTGFAGLFTDLGIGGSIVHNRTLRTADKDTAFWVNALSGFALTALFAGLSVPFAAFYHQPGLVGLILLASVDFSISMYIVPSALLQRDLKFNLITKVEVSAAILNAIVSVSLATMGFGAYSIVGGLLAQTTLTTVLMNRAAAYWPRGFITRDALRTMWGFSGHLFGFNVVNYWSRNLDNLLIGRFSGTAELAFYARAYNLMMLPVQQGTLVIGRVLFPALASIQTDVRRLREAYLRSLVALTVIVVPLSVALAASAHNLIVVLYGERWATVAPLLTIMAISGPAQIISGVTGTLYQAVGRTDVQLRRGLFNTAVTVVAIVIGLHWGALGVATALLIKFYLLLPNATAGCWPLIDLRWSIVLRRLTPVATSAVTMAGVMVVVNLELSGGAPWLVLICESVAGLAAYVATMIIVGRAVIADLRTLLHRSPAR